MKGLIRMSTRKALQCRGIRAALLCTRNLVCKLVIHQNAWISGCSGLNCQKYQKSPAKEVLDQCFARHSCITGGEQPIFAQTVVLN